MSFSRDYVENLARGSSPTSMAIMKRQVYEQLHRGLGQAEYDSQRLMLESFGRGDFKEGVQLVPREAATGLPAPAARRRVSIR